MQTIKVDLGKDWKFVNLYPIGDSHAGSAHFLKKELQKHIDVIKNDNHAQVILNGDLINNAIKTSVSDIYEEKLNPEEAIDMLVDLFNPIKHKIIGVVNGNHENRTSKITGINILKNMCYRLGIMDYYHPIANIIFLSFGENRGRENVRNTFSIYHTHGSGGGRTVGSKTNNVHRLAQVIHADVYIHSHTHTPLTFKEDYIVANCSNKGVKQVSRLFINTNAYEGFGGYGEIMKLPPSNHDPVKVVLTADERGNKIMKGTV